MNGMSLRLFKGILAMGAVAAVPAGNAADVTSYSVSKGHVYSQSSAGAPTSTGYNFTAAVEGDLVAINSAMLQGPGSFPIELSENSAGTRLEFTLTLADLNQIQAIFGNGEYNFTIDTDTVMMRPRKSIRPAPLL
jgi:hypothetical protein